MQSNGSDSSVLEQFYGEDYDKGELSEETIQAYYQYKYNEAVEEYGYSDERAQKYAQRSVEKHIAAAKERAETLASQQAIQEQKEAELEAERQQIRDDWNAQYGIGGLTYEEYSELSSAELD